MIYPFKPRLRKADCGRAQHPKDAHRTENAILAQSRSHALIRIKADRGPGRLALACASMTDEEADVILESLALSARTDERISAADTSPDRAQAAAGRAAVTRQLLARAEMGPPEAAAEVDE